MEYYTSIFGGAYHCTWLMQLLNTFQVSWGSLPMKEMISQIKHDDLMCAAYRYTCFYRLCVDRMSIRSLDDAHGRIVRIVYSPCIDVFTMMLQMDRFCEKGNTLESQVWKQSSLIPVFVLACSESFDLADIRCMPHIVGQYVQVPQSRTNNLCPDVRNTLMPMHCSDLAGDPVINRCIGFTLDNLASTMFR